MILSALCLFGDKLVRFGVLPAVLSLIVRVCCSGSVGANPHIGVVAVLLVKQQCSFFLGSEDRLIASLVVVHLMMFHLQW